MAFIIETSYEADDDMDALARHQQVIIREAFDRYLRDTPNVPSNRRKPIDPNPLGVLWELRAGDLRAFYDVDEQAGVVRIVRVGKKAANDLYVRGVKFNLRGQP